MNTTHVILFKSPRDLQQIDNFGRQLKQLELIREAYQRATTRPFGHLLMEFDPKTSDVLRICSNIVAPQPTTYYIPSSTAKERLLTNEHLPKHWQENKKRKGISRVIHGWNREQIKFLCECALNIINGNIPMNVKKLKPFEQQLKNLCQLQTSDRERRQILSSIKSYKLLKMISCPCNCYLSAK